MVRNLRSHESNCGHFCVWVRCFLFIVLFFPLFYSCHPATWALQTCQKEMFLVLTHSFFLICSFVTLYKLLTLTIALVVWNKCVMNTCRVHCTYMWSEWNSIGIISINFEETNIFDASYSSYLFTLFLALPISTSQHA